MAKIAQRIDGAKNLADKTATQMELADAVADLKGMSKVDRRSPSSS